MNFRVMRKSYGMKRKRPQELFICRNKEIDERREPKRTQYGATDALISRLRSMGYEDVRILNTSNGFFFSRRDSIITLRLNGSKLLIGRK